jgi:hypothetical protein
VQSGDPLTFTAAMLVLIVVAAGACYLPARRALCTDPSSHCASDSSGSGTPNGPTHRRRCEQAGRIECR